jgi:hypothetical protein
VALIAAVLLFVTEDLTTFKMLHHLLVDPLFAVSSTSLKTSSNFTIQQILLLHVFTSHHHHKTVAQITMHLRVLAKKRLRFI